MANRNIIIKIKKEVIKMYTEKLLAIIKEAEQEKAEAEKTIIYANAKIEVANKMLKDEEKAVEVVAEEQVENI
jgi:hypothetical protein